MKNIEEIKAQTKANRDEFIDRVNAEFGGAEKMEELKNQKQDILATTGGDSVCIKKDILATRLAQEGYIYNVHIGRCRFVAKLQPKDIGLDPKDPVHEEFIQSYLSLGEKKLLEDKKLKYLDSLDNKMRSLVKYKYGIPTCVGSFVPYKNISLLKADFEKLKTEYYQTFNEIIENYEHYRQKTADQYREFAAVVYQTIKRDDDYIPTTEEFVGKTMAYFPTREEARASVYAYLDIGVVQGTAFLTEQAARLKAVKEREALYRKEVALLDRKLNEESRIQSEREQQRIRLEREKMENLIKEERLKRSAIEEAVAQERKRVLPEIKQVFSDLSGAVYGIVYDAVNKVTESLKVRGSLGPAASKSLACLIEKAQTLSIQPDPNVELWLKNIKLLLDTPANKRDAGEVQDVLNGIKAESAKVILDIGRVPRSIRDVTLADIEASLENMPPAGPRQTRLFTDGMTEPESGPDMPDVEPKPLVRGDFRALAG